MSDEHPSNPTASAAHEKGKSRRRRAILDAAREIILRSGESGMTMRAMAAEAGVSPATPYNLFGSKQAILQAIYDEDYASFTAAFEARASHDALIRIFDLADFSIDLFKQHPDFYRALVSILQRNSGSEVDSRSWSMRTAYMKNVLSEAIAAGELRADTSVGVVSAALTRIVKAVAQEWVDGALTLDQARQQLGVSFALVLASLITPAGAPAFERARLRYEGSIGLAG